MKLFSAKNNFHNFLLLLVLSMTHHVSFSVFMKSQSVLSEVLHKSRKKINTSMDADDTHQIILHDVSSCTLLGKLFHIWSASNEFGTYLLCQQRRFRRACAFAQSRQNLRCLLIQIVSQEEPSDRKPDPWPL